MVTILCVHDCVCGDVHVCLCVCAFVCLQIVMAKLMDPGPVLVLSFQAQQLTLKSRDKEVEQVRMGRPCAPRAKIKSSLMA